MPFFKSYIREKFVGLRTIFFNVRKSHVHNAKIGWDVFQLLWKLMNLPILSFMIFMGQFSVMILHMFLLKILMIAKVRLK